MKICYVSGNVPRIINLMSDMKKRGHEIHWISLDIPKYKIPGIIVHNSVRLYSIGFIRRNLLLPYLYFLFKEKLKYISPDILHAINVKWAGWLSVASGFKSVIVTTQGSDVMVRRDYRNDLLHRWLRKYTLKNAAVVTYGNEAMLRDIKLHASPKRAFKYYAGVNFDQPSFKISPIELRHELGIANREVVFSPRGFDPNSNLDILVKTILIVREKFPSVLYVFARHNGGRNYALQLKELIQKLDVWENCLFLGEIPLHEMRNYYSMSDVIISILSSDGMAATILEGMAMKKILVISRIPSYLELMPEKYALMVPLRNKEATAHAIIKGIVPNEDTAQMKTIGYNWALQNANIKKLNDELENLYLKIAK